METTGNVYTCSGGETFDSIAADIWGDEKYASELMCVNPETCTTTEFMGGEILRLPDITLPEENEDGDTTEPEKAPWKE